MPDPTRLWPSATRPSRPTAAGLEAPATLPPPNRNLCIRACPSLYPPVADCQETGIHTKPNAHMRYGTTFTYHYRVENSNFSTIDSLHYLHNSIHTQTEMNGEKLECVINSCKYPQGESKTAKSLLIAPTRNASVRVRVMMQVLTMH